MSILLRLAFTQEAFQLHLNLIDLIEWVGSGAPVGEEQAEADCLEDSGS